MTEGDLEDSLLILRSRIRSVDFEPGQPQCKMP